MSYIFRSPFNVVDIIREIVPLHFGSDILDPTAQFEFKFFLSPFKCKPVIGKGGNGIHKELLAHDAVPAHGSSSIAPGYPGREIGLPAVESKYISSEISTHKQLVFWCNPVIELGIEVIEI